MSGLEGSVTDKSKMSHWLAIYLLCMPEHMFSYFQRYITLHMCGNEICIYETSGIYVKRFFVSLHGCELFIIALLA